MTLAPTLTQDTATRPKASPQAKVTLDAGLLLAGLTVAAALFFQGGLETLLGACVGALIGAATARTNLDRASAAISGAMAGLFAGALGAAFFHSLLFAFF